MFTVFRLFFQEKYLHCMTTAHASLTEVQVGGIEHGLQFVALGGVAPTGRREVGELRRREAHVRRRQETHADPRPARRRQGAVRTVARPCCHQVKLYHTQLLGTHNQSVKPKPVSVKNGTSNSSTPSDKRQPNNLVSN